MKNIIYRIFSKFRLTKNIVKNIEERMELIYPGNRELVLKITQWEIMKIFVVNVLVFCVLVVYGKIDFCYVVMAMIVMMILTKSMVYSKFDKEDISLLKSFEKYIQDVRFKFKYDGMIDEALKEALQNVDKEMYMQGSRIISSLESNQKEETSYTEIAPNSFFMTFYALCETVKIYGDKQVDGRSLFVTNLSYLKDDINIELLKREKIAALFMGLKGITILPVFAIKPICMWGGNNIEALNGYYNSSLGKMSFVIITLIMMIIFNIIMKLRYPVEFENQKSIWVDDILRIKYFDKIMMKLISNNYKKYYDMDMFLKSVVYKYNVKEFMVHRIVSGLIAFIMGVTLSISLGLYKKGIFGIILILCIAFLPAIIAYYYEIIMLLIRQSLLRISREEEIIRYQSVILILMHMDRVSVETLIEWMENFAVVFKNTLEKIADTLIYKGMKVFSDAKDEVQFLPFERLMDCFIASDRIGISKAFSDIGSDRLYYVEKHKQENEIIINNKATIAKFIAFIPICMVICFVLVLPFIYQGLQQLQNFKMM